MILEFDVGNSRIKWRHVAPDGAIAAQGLAKDSLELLSQLPKGEPDGIRVCSVRKGDALRDLIGHLKGLYLAEPAVARVLSHCGGVTIHYQDPSRLGADRWLAMLAAFSKSHGASIVIDGGTALTIDVLGVDGEHRGGYILPGLKMMTESLESNTGIVLSQNSLSPSTVLGHSTDQAVQHGAIAAHAALIEKTIVAALSGQPLSVFFSGGDGQILSDAVSVNLDECSGVQLSRSIAPDLVLDGLAIACPVKRDEV